MFLCEIGIIILVCQILGSVGPIQEKIRLPLPYFIMIVDITFIVYDLNPTFKLTLF